MLQDIGLVMIGPERKAVWVAILLAFFNQGCASTAVINYAPTVLEGAGVRNYADATAWTAMITGAKVRPWSAVSAACARWHTGCNPMLPPGCETPGALCVHRAAVRALAFPCELKCHFPGLPD